MRLNIFKSLFGLCVATMAVSCSNDQVIDDLRPAGGNDSDMISFMVADDNTRGGSFGNRPGLSTRATVTTTDNIKNPNVSFAVYGDMTLESSTDRIVLFNGESVNYNQSQDIWEYSNVRYWFTNREYSFVGLYPNSIEGMSGLTYENSRLAFTYTLPSDYTQATDILIAGHRRQASSTNVDKKVELCFGHLMSRLNFVAKIDPIAKDLGIEIKKITIKGVASKASFSVLPAAIQAGYSETSDLTLTNPVWTISQTPGRISLSKVPTGSTIETYNENSTVCKSLFPTVDPLFIIPQGVTSDVIVELTYSQKNKDDTTIEGRLRSASSVHGYTWAPGRSYTYTFTLGVDDFIIFDKPDVSAWDEDEGGNYIVVG